jgi:hypothetical protein
MDIQTWVSYPILEAFLLGQLRPFLANHRGVAVDELSLTIKDKDAHSVRFCLVLAISKMARLIRAEIMVEGCIKVGPGFGVTVSRLSASSEGLRGLIGSVAGLFVDVGRRTHLSLVQWEGSYYPLGPLFPGCEFKDVRVRCHPQKLEVALLFAD